MLFESSLYSTTEQTCVSVYVSFIEKKMVRQAVSQIPRYPKIKVTVHRIKTFKIIIPIKVQANNFSPKPCASYLVQVLCLYFLLEGDQNHSRRTFIGFLV